MQRRLVVCYRRFGTDYRPHLQGSSLTKSTLRKILEQRRSAIQSCSVYICLRVYILTVMNTTILQLVAIYNIQLHVSALYVGHHQVVQRTY